MSGTFRDVGLVLVFILVGSFFVIAEMALVSLRDSQAKALEGTRTARRRPSPGSTATPTGSWPPSRSASRCRASCRPRSAARRWPAGCRRHLEDWGMSRRADTTALVLITLAISYVSLVIGELAPKRLALQRAESISLAVGADGRPDRQACPAGHLAAVGVDRTSSCGCSAATPRRSASRSPMPRSASSCPARRPSGPRSGRSSRTSSRQATARSAR